MNIFTVGHSTLTGEQFIQMLIDTEIEHIVDVRAFPASRKFPQFNQEALINALEEKGIAYTHLTSLGGRRGTSNNVGENLNEGWRNRSFHNYADYTLTESFLEGLNSLKQLAKKHRVAYMCSERHPARCHRLLISNKLTVDGWDVFHIVPQNDKTELVKHELGQWGAMPIIEADDTVVYPKI